MRLLNQSRSLGEAHSTRLDVTKLSRTLRVVVPPPEHQSSFETNTKYNYIRDLQLQQAEEPVQLMRDEVRPILPEIPGQPAPDSENPGE